MKIKIFKAILQFTALIATSLILLSNSFAEENANSEAPKKEKAEILADSYSQMLETTNAYIEEMKNSDIDINPDNDIVVIFTDLGYISFHLNNKAAPKSIRAVRLLVKSGFYDDLEFFRAIANYFVQFGDPSSSGSGGSGVFIEDEFGGMQNHVRGTVAMANFGTPSSQDSQLFIVLNRSPWLNRKYNVIGTVIHGIEIVDSISRMKALDNSLIVEPMKINKMVLFSQVDKINPKHYNNISEVGLSSKEQNEVVEKNLEYENEIQKILDSKNPANVESTEDSTEQNQDNTQGTTEPSTNENTEEEQATDSANVDEVVEETNPTPPAPAEPQRPDARRGR